MKQRGDPSEGAPPDGTCDQELLLGERKAGAVQDEAREVRMIRALHTAVVSATGSHMAKHPTNNLADFYAKTFAH